MLAVGRTRPDFQANKMDGGSFEESVVRSETGLSFFIQKHENFTRDLDEQEKRLKNSIKD